MIQRWARYWYMTLPIIIVAFYNLWVISAGTWTNWPVHVSYYHLLSNAFSYGQLHLLIEPRPELLALSNPYNSDINQEYRFQDAVLFQGKYYLYWGPVPALFILPFEFLNLNFDIRDDQIVFAFSIVNLVFMSLLLKNIRNHLFSQIPDYVVAIVIVAIGLSPHLTFTLARPMVYEAAILGGQCFLIACLWIITHILWKSHKNPWLYNHCC